MTDQTSHPDAYARGVLQVDAETLRARCAELSRTIEVLLSALDGGAQWEIDTARDLARRELRFLGGKS